MSLNQLRLTSETASRTRHAGRIVARSSHSQEKWRWSYRVAILFLKRDMDTRLVSARPSTPNHGRSDEPSEKNRMMTPNTLLFSVHQAIRWICPCHVEQMERQIHRYRAPAGQETRVRSISGSTPLSYDQSSIVSRSYIIQHHPREGMRDCRAGAWIYRGEELRELSTRELGL